MAKKKSQHKKKGSKAGQSITQHPSATPSSASADSSRPVSPTPEEPSKEAAAAVGSEEVQAAQTPVVEKDVALPETPMPGKTLPSSQGDDASKNSTTTPSIPTTDLSSSDDQPNPAPTGSAPTNQSAPSSPAPVKVSDLPSSHNQVQRASPDHEEVPLPDFRPNDEVAEKHEGRREEVSSENGEAPEEPTSHPTASAGTEVALEEVQEEPKAEVEEEVKEESEEKEAVKEEPFEESKPVVGESKPVEEAKPEPAVKEKTEAELERERMMEARIAGARHMIMLAEREKKEKVERARRPSEDEVRAPFKEDSFTRGISDAFNRKKSSFTPIDDNGESAITDEPDSESEEEDYQSLRMRNPGMFISNLPRRFTMEEGPKFAPSQAATPPKSILATPVGERMSFSGAKPNLNFNESSLIHDEEVVPESTSGKIQEILKAYKEVPGDEPIASGQEGPEPTDDREFLPSGSRRSSILGRFRPPTPQKGEPTESPSEADARVMAHALHASLQEAPSNSTKLSHGLSHSYTGASSQHPGRSTPPGRSSHPGRSIPHNPQSPAAAPRKLTLEQLPEIKPEMLINEHAAAPKTPDETGRPTPHHGAAAELDHELKEEAEKAEEKKDREIKPEEISSQPAEKEEEEKLEQIEDDRTLPIDKDEPLSTGENEKEEPTASDKSFFDVDAPKATSTDPPTTSTDASALPTTTSDVDSEEELPINSVPLLDVEQPGGSIPTDLDEHSVLSNIASPAGEKAEPPTVEREESPEIAEPEKELIGEAEVTQIENVDDKEEARFDKEDTTAHVAPGVSGLPAFSVVPDPPSTAIVAEADPSSKPGPTSATASDSANDESALSDLPATPAEEKDEILPIDREDFSAVPASTTSNEPASDPTESSTDAAPTTSSDEAAADVVEKKEEKKTYSSIASLPNTPAEESEQVLPIDREDFDISALAPSASQDKEETAEPTTEDVESDTEGELIPTQRDQPEADEEEKIPSIDSLPTTPAEEKDEILPIDQEQPVEELIAPKVDREAAIEAVRQSLAKEEPKEVEPKKQEQEEEKIPSLDSLPATPAEEKEALLLPIDRNEPVEETLKAEEKTESAVPDREAAIEAVREALRKEQPKEEDKVEDKVEEKKDDKEEEKVPSLDSLPATPAEEKEGMLPIDRDEPVEELLKDEVVSESQPEDEQKPKSFEVPKIHSFAARPVPTPSISTLDISDLPPTPAEEKDEILPIDKEESSIPASTTDIDDSPTSTTDTDSTPAPGLVPSAIDEDHDPEEEQEVKSESEVAGDDEGPKEERRRTGSVDIRVEVETAVHRSPPDVEGENLGATKEEETEAEVEEEKPLIADVDAFTIAKTDDSVAPSTPPITEPISIPWEHVQTPTDSLPTKEKEAKEVETSEAPSIETAGEIADDLGLKEEEITEEAKEEIEADSTVQSTPSESEPLVESTREAFEATPGPADVFSQEPLQEPSVETPAEIADDLDLKKTYVSEAAAPPAVSDEVDVVPASAEESIPEPSISTDATPKPEAELEEENADGPSIEDATEISADPYASKPEVAEEVPEKEEEVVGPISTSETEPHVNLNEASETPSGPTDVFSQEHTEEPSVETATEIANELDLETTDRSDEAAATLEATEEAVSAPAVTESTPEPSSLTVDAMEPEAELEAENVDGPSIEDATEISADPYDSKPETSEEVVHSEEKFEPTPITEDSSADAVTPASTETDEVTESEMASHAVELVGAGILSVAGVAAAGIAALSSSSETAVRELPQDHEKNTETPLPSTVSELLSQRVSTSTEVDSNQGEPPSTPAVERSTIGFDAPVTFAAEEEQVDTTPAVSAEEVFSREEVPEGLLTGVQGERAPEVHRSEEPEPTPLPSKLRDPSSITSISSSSAEGSSPAITSASASASRQAAAASAGTANVDLPSSSSFSASTPNIEKTSTTVSPASASASSAPDPVSRSYSIEICLTIFVIAVYIFY